MKKYLIERHIPGVHLLSDAQRVEAATVSNNALAKLAPRVEWIESFLVPDKTFCVYLAEDEAVIHEHAALSGFPANHVSEIFGGLSPATGA